MTATIKEFCRINGIDESSADLADIIFEALTGGDYGSTDRHSAAGKKSKLQFPTALRERLIAECGFTLEEKAILNLRADGYSLIEIADRQHCSVETVNRRIRCIKNKIAALIAP